VEVKVGFCVAYDWQLLAFSLPRVYENADLIYLSLDRKRISWSGNKYAFNDRDFHELVQHIDFASKIRVIEDDYYLPELTPMENEVRQRNELAIHLGKGGWHIQLDCDEYFIAFGEFVKYLRSLPVSKTRRTNVSCPWFVLFKQTEKGYLCIDPITIDRVEYMQIATRQPYYEYGRRNGNFNLYTNFLILHQSWARSESEIKDKIANWGHSNDFDRKKYFDFWKSLNSSNYNEAIDFHWLQPKAWPRLVLIQARSINEIITHSSKIRFPYLSSIVLFYKNSRTISRLKKVIKIFISNG
jgi:hypothetical protein